MCRPLTYGRLVRVLDTNGVPPAVLDHWAPHLRVVRLTLPRTAMHIDAAKSVYARLLHARLHSLKGPAAALTSDGVLQHAGLCSPEAAPAGVGGGGVLLHAPPLARLERLKLLPNAVSAPGAAGAGALLDLLGRLPAMTAFEDARAVPPTAVDSLTPDVFVHLAGRPKLRILVLSGEVSAASLDSAIARHNVRSRLPESSTCALASGQRRRRCWRMPFAGCAALVLRLGETHHRFDGVWAASPRLDTLAVMLRPGAGVKRRVCRRRAAGRRRRRRRRR
jgi:hypothetical protein